MAAQVREYRKAPKTTLSFWARQELYDQLPVLRRLTTL